MNDKAQMDTVAIERFLKSDLFKVNPKRRSVASVMDSVSRPGWIDALDESGHLLMSAGPKTQAAIRTLLESNKVKKQD